MKHLSLTLSASPHVHSGHSVGKLTTHMMLALTPAVFAGWFFFGWHALKIVLISTAAAVAAEYAWQKGLGLTVRIADGSSVITGALFGLLLPSEAPWWIPLVGAPLAVIVGKELLGGFGNHPFNSVLVGWAFTKISYSDFISDFPFPEPRFWLEPGESLTDHPLIAFKDDISSIMDVSWIDFLIGNIPGELGAVSVAAVLMGGGYLLFRRVITWHIPLSFIVSVWVFAFIFWKIDPDLYAHPTFHLLSGWVMIGAFFLAPEQGTAPVTVPGMILYGMGCGILTVVIRIWGTYIEGVPFAILLMNGLTPLLDRIRQKAIGRNS